MEKRLLSREEKLAIINEAEQSGNITQVIRKQDRFPVKLRITKKDKSGSLTKSRMTKSASSLTTPLCHSALPLLSFPRKRESRIKRFWIPNQVGDDSGCDFEDPVLF